MKSNEFTEFSQSNKDLFIKPLIFRTISIKIDEKLDKIGVDVSVADTSGDVSGAA